MELPIPDKKVFILKLHPGVSLLIYNALHIKYVSPFMVYMQILFMPLQGCHMIVMFPEITSNSTAAPTACTNWQQRNHRRSELSLFSGDRWIPFTEDQQWRHLESLLDLLFIITENMVSDWIISYRRGSNLNFKRPILSSNIIDTLNHSIKG